MSNQITPNPSAPSQVVAEVKFPRWINNLGIIPTSYKDSMSYYECLAWLCKFLEETVIPTVNENGEAVEELQNLYVELNNYVTHYFETLDVQEEINNKLDAMVEDGSLELLLAKYNDPKVDYFKIKTTDTFDTIKDYFETDRPKVIEFEKGTYTLTDRIYLTSNSKVLLNNSVLNSTYTDSNSDNIVFLSYGPDSEYTDYNGTYNIEFYNGTINTGFAFMHSTNILFNNIKFESDITSHNMQIAGCKNVKIINCEFNGTLINDSTGMMHENIQLESCTYNSQPFLPEESSSFDNTGNNNIEICYCTFKKGDDINNRNYVNIGHHAFNVSNEYPNEYIKIHDNTFETTRYSAISTIGLNNFEIYNNYFEEESEFNDQIHIRLRSKHKNGKIHDNIFASGLRAIQNANANQIDNLEIFNNKISLLLGNSIGIYLQSVSNCKIYNNEIKAKYRCILLVQATNTSTEKVKIFNNKFDMSEVLADTGFGIHCTDVSDLEIIDNVVYQTSTAQSFLYLSTGNTDYKFLNNLIYNPNSATKNDVAGSSINFSNIYNSIRNELQAAAGYTAYTNQSVTYPFNQFNTIRLLVHRNNSPTIMSYVILKPYILGETFSDSRTFNVSMYDSVDGTMLNGTFKINSDGTFNYTSSDELTLRKVDAYNELLY